MLIVTLFGRDCFLKILEGNISLIYIGHQVLEFISKFDRSYNLQSEAKYLGYNISYHPQGSTYLGDGSWTFHLYGTSYKFGEIYAFLGFFVAICPYVDASGGCSPKEEIHPFRCIFIPDQITNVFLQNLSTFFFAKVLLQKQFTILKRIVHSFYMQKAEAIKLFYLYNIISLARGNIANSSI